MATDALAVMATYEQWHRDVIEAFQPQGKLLFIPSCAATKPYSAAPTHKKYMAAISQAVRDVLLIDKVSLSGLLGPVPAQWEERVPAYNFYLNRSAHTRGHHKEIMLRLADYMEAFLRCHGEAYAGIVFYGRERYRSVMDDVSGRLAGTATGQRLYLLPRLSTRLRGEGLDELQAVTRELLAHWNHSTTGSAASQNR